jgi:hypothetical protein
MQGEYFYKIDIDNCGRPLFEVAKSVGTGTLFDRTCEILALKGDTKVGLTPVLWAGDGIPNGYFRSAQAAKAAYLSQLRAEHSLLTRRIEEGEKLSTNEPELKAVWGVKEGASGQNSA